MPIVRKKLLIKLSQLGKKSMERMMMKEYILFLSPGLNGSKAEWGSIMRIDHRQERQYYMQMAKNGYKSPCNRFYIGQKNGKVFLVQFPYNTLQTCGSLDCLIQWMVENNKKNQYNLVQGNNPLQNWRQ